MARAARAASVETSLNRVQLFVLARNSLGNRVDREIIASVRVAGAGLCNGAGSASSARIRVTLARGFHLVDARQSRVPGRSPAARRRVLLRKYLKKT